MVDPASGDEALFILDHGHLFKGFASENDLTEPTTQFHYAHHASSVNWVSIASFKPLEISNGTNARF